MMKTSLSKGLPQVSKDHAADYSSVAERLQGRVTLNTPEEEPQHMPSPWSNHEKE